MCPFFVCAAESEGLPTRELSGSGAQVEEEDLNLRPLPPAGRRLNCTNAVQVLLLKLSGRLDQLVACFMEVHNDLMVYLTYNYCRLVFVF